MRIVRIAAVLLVVVLGAAYYLFGRETVPPTSGYEIDLQALASAAQSMAGDPPVAVHHLEVARATMPRAAVFGGFDFSPHAMVHGAYQVVYADGSFGLIDTGFGHPVAQQMAERGETTYDESGFEAVKKAMAGAAWIVLTHEHADHIQGLAELGDAAEVAPRVILNERQAANPSTRELLPDSLLAAIEPRPLDALTAIAPGVAVLPAPGHTPGSQLVYVRPAAGPELLFIGDVAWNRGALERLEYRPRLVTDFYLGEDRAAVLAQFRTLHALLARETPVVIPSHDAEWLAALQQRGILGRGPAPAKASARTD